MAGVVARGRDVVEREVESRLGVVVERFVVAVSELLVLFTSTLARSVRFRRLLALDAAAGRCAPSPTARHGMRAPGTRPRRPKTRRPRRPH